MSKGFGAPKHRSDDPGEHMLAATCAVQTAADLCRESVFVQTETRNKEIFDLFERNADLLNIPVLSNGEIVGLINRDNFMRAMARRYHWELYASKRCTKMMDEMPLAVQADMPIRELAKQLIDSGHPHSLSEGFVIVRGMKLLGTGLTSDVLAAILVYERLLTEELKRANEQLRELTITDGLTGLYNRRHFNTVIDVELRRAHRDKESVALIMLDIDHFKKLNDRLGHQAGDDALQSVAAELKMSVRRPSDYCFRLGGEEFAVLVADAFGESIEVFAESLRRNVTGLKLPNPDYSLGILTISLGVALSDPGGETSSSLYSRADKALYKAKSKGRNTVAISE